MIHISGEANNLLQTRYNNEYEIQSRGEIIIQFLYFLCPT
uniref:Uncharacterized protein n=1 Tax=Heterorhabditis bacteriophora TaxID=37862 RepID=A0A1I7XCX3_HETBA